MIQMKKVHLSFAYDHQPSSPSVGAALAALGVGLGARFFT